LGDSGVVLADARDLDPAEQASLAASQVRRVPADPAAISAALDDLSDMPVYLHLDVDVIADPRRVRPGTPTPTARIMLPGRGCPSGLPLAR